MRSRLPALSISLSLCVGVVTACHQEELILPRRRTAQTETRVATTTTASEARAFVIEREADLLRGPEADGRVGDFRLDNGVVAFVIDRIGSTLGFAESGGNLIDAAPEGGKDALKQLFGYLDDTFPRQPIFERAEITRRGSAAVVRASGRDSQDDKLMVTTEYALEPGSSALQITTSVTNAGTQVVTAYEIGDAILWGRTEKFAPSLGFEVMGRQRLKEGWIAGIGAETAYAYVQSDPAQPLLGNHDSAWSDLNVKTVDIAAGQTMRATRWFVVGARGDTSSLAEAIATVRKMGIAVLSGKIVEEGSAAPILGALVTLEDRAGKKISLATSRADGSYTVRAPSGDYHINVSAKGRRGPDGVEVTLRESRETTVDLLLSRSATVLVSVTEANKPVPAKLTWIDLDRPNRPPRFGAPYEIPAGNVTLTATGNEKLTMPPGNYRVIASRGPEYAIDVRELALKAGSELTLALSPSRSVDTSGLLCVDLHQHTVASSDSSVSLVDRAISNLAEGLDVLVATDHNRIADWAHALGDLRPARPITVIEGNEITREGVGDFAAFPLKREAFASGALDLRDKSAKEIVAGLRAAGSGSEIFVQVIHPRSSSVGYFNTLKFDPRADALPADWEGGFDGIEVFSSKDPSKVEVVLADWFSLLNRGLVYTAVGGSDSHVIHPVEVGYPRTCVTLAKGERPGHEALVAGLKRRRDAIVTNGPFVRIEVAGRGMGQIAPTVKGRARLELTIDAAPWVDVRRYEVYVNGQRRGKPVALPARGDKATHWKGGVDLRIDRDSYVVVLVRGDDSLEPVLARIEGAPVPTPLAITNPIYLDRDGDGKYSAVPLRAK